jgi:hypothetical protein
MIRGFDAYSNSCLEGTNYAVKYCGNGVKPNMSGAKATKVMVNQDEDKAVRGTKSASDALTKLPLYTKTITSGKLRTVAESMFQQQNEECDNYMSLRLGETTWWVLRSTPRKPDGIIPTFSRIRIVSIDNNNEMHCSCGFIDRNGIPCRHVVHAARKFGIEFKSFTHHDIDLRFHTSYCSFVASKDPALMSEDEQEIRSRLLKARKEELSGPTAPSFQKFSQCRRFVAGTKSEEKFRHFNLSDATDYFMQHGTTTVVVNYGGLHVDQARKAVGHAAGMTQEASFPTFCENDTFPTFCENDTVVLKPITVYERLNPLCKDILRLFDGLSGSNITEAERLLKNIVNLGQRFRAEELPPPTGQVVSCIPVNPQTGYKHKKQKRF